MEDLIIVTCANHSLPDFTMENFDFKIKSDKIFT